MATTSDLRALPPDGDRVRPDRPALADAESSAAHGRDATAVASVRVRAAVVPVTPPVETAGGVLREAPLVLVDVTARDGVTGSAYVGCYTPAALAPLARLVEALGATLVGGGAAPLAAAEALERRLRLLGPQGLTGMAAAGLDLALWDALARRVGLPLAAVLGAELAPTPAYASLRAMGAEAAAREAAVALAAGYGGVKLRLGHSRLTDDLAAVRAVRAAVGADVALMVDYNQSLSVPEAERRLRALAELGLVWAEEPVRADDHAGHAAVRRAGHVPVQTGENWWGPADVARSLAAGASDFAMLDAVKVGGVTGWLRGAALAAAGGLPVSSHLYPEVSAHLLAATPGRHWLEILGLADAVLRAPLRPRAGVAVPGAEPGSGVAWDEAAVTRYRVEW